MSNIVNMPLWHCKQALLPMLIFFLVSLCTSDWLDLAWLYFIFHFFWPLHEPIYKTLRSLLFSKCMFFPSTCSSVLIVFSSNQFCVVGCGWCIQHTDTVQSADRRSFIFCLSGICLESPSGSASESLGGGGRDGGRPKRREGVCLT